MFLALMREIGWHSRLVVREIDRHFSSMDKHVYAMEERLIRRFDAVTTRMDRLSMRRAAPSERPYSDLARTR